MNPCEVGLLCQYWVIDWDGDLCCAYFTNLELMSKCECPLVEESSDMYNWLQVMDDPTVQLAIEKANKVRDEEAQKLCEEMLGRRKRIEEQEKKVDREDPF